MRLHSGLMITNKQSMPICSWTGVRMQNSFQIWWKLGTPVTVWSLNFCWKTPFLLANLILSESRKQVHKNLKVFFLVFSSSLQSHMFDGKIPQWHHYACFWRRFDYQVESHVDIGKYTIVNKLHCVTFVGMWGWWVCTSMCVYLYLFLI